MREKYVVPSHNADAFNCPHCGAYAHQEWYLLDPPELIDLSALVDPHATQDGNMSICSRCDRHAFWHENRMVYPGLSIGPLPVEDMPKDVKEDFIEARDIVGASPRAAAALLRLALQKLMPHLEEKGKNLNDDIANLVKKGLPVRIQKALDIVRVIGNNAVHPGELDLRDDAQTAIALFELLNMIVELLITQPKKLTDLYDKIPDSTKEAIRKRDKKP